MKIVLKRVAAYLVDIILVSIIATFLTSNSYINKDYKKYTKVYNEYSETNEEYLNYLNKLENFYEDEKITKKEYNTLVEFSDEYEKDLKKFYEDNKITKTEYGEIVENLNASYSEQEIDYSYKLLKYSVIPTIVNLMCILFYFVVIQFYFDGQTLGKKLLRLKVVSNNQKQLTIFNYFIRSLIVNEVFINILNVIFLLVLSKNNYLVYNQIIYVFTYILEMTIMFTIVFDKNNRGIHDYISNTKLIESKKE